MNDDMKGKRWEELLLLQIKKIQNSYEKLKEIVIKIDELNFDMDVYDFESYIKAIDHKIHTPRWNKYPSTNPDQLKVHAESYHIFVEPDFFSEAHWMNGNFVTFNEFRESGNDWENELNVAWWLPITYPTPY